VPAVWLKGAASSNSLTSTQSPGSSNMLMGQFPYQHFLLNHENIVLSTRNSPLLYPITPGQCRAARALLDITQPELAALAELGLSTIVDFEKSRRDVSHAAVVGIAKALQKAGIVFIAKNGGGPGVRLKY
jgi:hypothetical protein